jgi:hypothetical protein
MGPDYRKVRYDPKAGRLRLVVCAMMVLIGSGEMLPAPKREHHPVFLLFSVNYATSRPNTLR